MRVSEKLQFHFSKNKKEKEEKRKGKEMERKGKKRQFHRPKKINQVQTAQREHLFLDLRRNKPTTVFFIFDETDDLN